MEHELTFDENDWSVLDTYEADQNDWHSNAVSTESFHITENNYYLTNLEEA
jgi:hypothetical protein